MKERIQILFIHGGTTFKNKKGYLQFLKSRKVSIEKKIKWNEDYLDKKLGRNFEIIRPNMPLKEDAKYDEWKIHFEKHFPYLRDNIILIGMSLGWIFLAKYLSENKFPKKILSVYLICPPFDNTLHDEDLVGGFRLKSDLSRINKNCKNLNLFFSEDDDTVPIAHSKKYQKKLNGANMIIYKSKNGHFKIPKFPEIIKMIKKDVIRLENGRKRDERIKT